jgi:predicted Zn-ribbon and HTH transcriptional regulator
MEDVTRCPQCHSEDLVRIVYGMPSEEMVEESVAGRVALGGCLVWPDAPDYTCQNCGYEWRADEAGS